MIERLERFARSREYFATWLTWLTWCVFMLGVTTGERRWGLFSVVVVCIAVVIVCRPKVRR